MHFRIPQVVFIVSCLFIATMLIVPPIPQSLEYHRFADIRRLIGIPHFWNVVSNLPFAVVGILGLLLQSRTQKTELLLPYSVFCVGVIFVAFGSAYYHYQPNNETLVWDRLPMTIAFMSLFSAVLGDSVLPKQSRKLLVALVLLGLASIFYWHYSKQMGGRDLRPYAMVQFLPMLAITWILLRYSLRNISGMWLWLTLGFYVLAKLLEHFDREVLVLTSHWQSGHSLKHVAAAFACACVVQAMIHRPASAELNHQ